VTNKVTILIIPLTIIRFKMSVVMQK